MAFQFTRETLQTIRRRVGALFPDFSTGVVLVAGTDYLQAEVFKRFPTGDLVGYRVTVSDLTNIYETRLITSNDQATGVAQVNPNWTTSAVVSSVIEIWPPDVLPDQVNNAINLAILDAQSVSSVSTRVTSPTISDDRLELDLSSTTLTKVSGVQYKSDAGVWTAYQHASHIDWMEERTFAWTLLGSTIFLSPAIPDDITDANISVLGYRPPALLDLESDSAEVRSDFLTYFAASVVARLRTGADESQRSGVADRWLQKAMDIKGQMDPSFAPNTYDIEA